MTDGATNRQTPTLRIVVEDERDALFRTTAASWYDIRA